MGIHQPLRISPRPTERLEDGWRTGDSAWGCCVRREQGGFINICTELLEYRDRLLVWERGCPPGGSVCSRGLKFHQGSLLFSVETREKTSYGHALQDGRWAWWKDTQDCRQPFTKELQSSAVFGGDLHRVGPAPGHTRSSLPPVPTRQGCSLGSLETLHVGTPTASIKHPLHTLGCVPRGLPLPAEQD